MNAFWKDFLGILAVSVVAGFAAAQGPGAADAVTRPTPVAASSPVPPQVVTLAEPNGAASPSERGGVIGGVGLYIMQPYFQHNPAYTVITQDQFTPVDPKTGKPTQAQFDEPNTQTLSDYAYRVNVHSHMEVAPLVWLGYVNQDGFGGRGRWWTFREGTSQTMTLPPFEGKIYIGMTTARPDAPSHPVILVTGNQATIASAAPLGLQAFGDTVGIQHGAEATALTVTTELYLSVGDLEAIQTFQTGGFDFLVSGGIRLAQIDQTYNAYDFQSAIPTAPRTLASTYNFRGIGPTLSLELRRALGSSGLGVYSIARGSAVFGSANQNAAFFGQELRNDDPNPQSASEHRNRAIPVADLEAGLEFGRQVSNSWLFGQIGLVAQEWFGAGSASRATNATVLTTGRPVIGGAPLDSNIAFLGLAVRLGLNY